MESIEVFSGAGGLALGLHLAGFQSRGLYEINANACETLRRNVRKASVKGIEKWSVQECDISAVDFSPFRGTHLVAGGPPCQPFSLAGKHQGNLDRRDMIPKFVDIVRQVAPEAFILENVRGLTRQQFLPYLTKIIKHLGNPTKVRRKERTTEPYYNIDLKVLNAADFGVPQVRYRLFIVGFKDSYEYPKTFPIPTHSKIKLMIDALSTRDYWRKHKAEADRSAFLRRLRNKRFPVLENEAGILPWQTVRDAISDLDANGGKRVSRARTRDYAGHTGSFYDLPAKTLKAGVHGVPGGENMVVFPDGRCRHFTVEEGLRIQTFPDSWEIYGSWSESMRQLGNAVPVQLAHAVAKWVHRTIAQGKGKEA